MNVEEAAAAIVCEHIAKRDQPILYAERTEPVDSADSGWQFLCNAASDESEDRAEVWSIRHVVQAEPSLSGLLNEPSGTVLTREDSTSPWKVRREA